MITGNTASGVWGTGGGGIRCDTASPTIQNNTITGNSSRDGGGIYCNSSSPTIVNTILAFNSSGICNVRSGMPSLRYTCVYGNSGYDYSGLTSPLGSNGNISADPRLADLSSGNVHIRPDSPCIDSGDDTVVQAGWLDMDCQPRIAGAHVDIGADESDGTIWPTGPNAIVRVSPAGEDANDGSSWTLAKRTVQAGINAAAAAGGEVWVAAGTYPEQITLLSFAHVFGGFAGTEAQRSERDWRTHETVLDGNQGGNVVTAAAGEHVSTIDGFTIRNGQGAGVYCWASSPTIANNLITRNSGGGGIVCCYAFPTIAGNTITGNSSLQRGGGIYCQQGNPTIVNNLIANNNTAYRAFTQGGGIYCDGSSPLIANNTIMGNVAMFGGGIYCEWDSAPTIVNTIVAFNGSGVECDDSSSPTFGHNCVYGNGYDFVGVADPTGTSGNISADPRLAGWRNGHIQPDSPCIDAGGDAAVQPDWQDVDGQARIAGAHVDIGADESDGTTWPSDPNVIIRVSPLGNDGNDGLSWVLAKRTVQGALNNAVHGDQVWVAAATYAENISVRAGVQLYGGFAGGETGIASGTGQRTRPCWTATRTAAS